MRLTLKIWRQGGKYKGEFVTYELPNVNEHMSFLEMLDVLNEELIHKGDEPIALPIQSIQQTLEVLPF